MNRQIPATIADKQNFPRVSIIIMPPHCFLDLVAIALSARLSVAIR
jgi:hypothetical protein